MKPGKIKSPVLIFGLFFLLLLAAGCKMIDLEDYKSIDPNNVISLFNPREGDTIRADGVETITFTALIHQNSEKRTIAFKTTSGTFAGSAKSNTINVIADNEGRAEAVLKVGARPGRGEVIATISGYRAVAGFTLQTAHADKILGETSTKLVKKNGSINAVLKAFLSRSGGMVSVGTEVEFSATQKNDQGQDVEVGRFIGTGENKARTGENQVATLTFSADKKNVLVRKAVKIKMTTKTDNGSTKQYMLTLNVIE